MIGCQTSRVTSGSLRCVSTCCDVFMLSRPRVCAIRLQTELSASHFLRDRPVTHTRSHVAPLHPQLAFCSTRCRAGSHSRALALTLHAHNLPNASCVTGTARGSLRCVLQLHQFVATSLSLVLQLCGDPWLSHLLESRRLAQVRRPPARREPVLSSLPCLDLDPAESSWPRLSLILLLAPASTLRESFSVSRRCEVSCSCEACPANSITRAQNSRFSCVSCSDRSLAGP